MVFCTCYKCKRVKFFSPAEQVVDEDGACWYYPKLLPVGGHVGAVGHDGCSSTGERPNGWAPG